MSRLRSLRRHPATPFVLVGMLLVALQLLLSGVGRAPSWDEAVYLANADAGGPHVPFAPYRARGIVWLVMPMVRLGSPLWAIRLALVIASSAALVVACAAWAPAIGRRRTLALTALFGGSWLVLFYGGEVMPNLWAAIALLAAGGLLARSLASGDGRPAWGAVVLVGVATLFRPFDATVAAVAFIAVVVWSGPPQRLRQALGFAAGLAAGWLPWFLEMAPRAGGPVQALADAAAVGHVAAGTGVVARLVQHLALADGPLIGPTDPASVPIGAVVWWVVALALGILAARHRDVAQRTAGRVALVAGAAAGLAYVLVVSGLAPRYMLPAIAFLSVGVVVAAGRLPRPAIAAVAIASIAWLAWQMAILVPVVRAATDDRAAIAETADVLQALAVGAPCRAFATDAAPQLAEGSGCPVTWIRPGDLPVRPPGGAFVLLHPGDPLPWPDLGVALASPPGWVIYRVP